MVHWHRLDVTGLPSRDNLDLLLFYLPLNRTLRSLSFLYLIMYYDDYRDLTLPTSPLQPVYMFLSSSRLPPVSHPTHPYPLSSGARQYPKTTVFMY